MGFCWNCKTKVESRFCGCCGQKATSSCTGCGHDLDGNEKFCPDCGLSVGSPEPTPTDTTPSPAITSEDLPTPQVVHDPLPSQPSFEPAKAAAVQISAPPIAQPKEAAPPQGMTRIPAGEFLFGENRTSETLPEFFIDIDPVTNSQYARFVAATRCRPPLFWRNGTIPEGRDDHPVVGVSLDDARAFAKWRGARLPTENEWEKAARGTDGRQYPWGDHYSEGYLNSKNAGVKDTTETSKYPSGRSPYGCSDMAGNVWDWTESWHDDRQKFKVLRGGSWYDVAAFCKCTTRFTAKQDYRSACLGFRCVVGEPLAAELESSIDAPPVGSSSGRDSLPIDWSHDGSTDESAPGTDPPRKSPEFPSAVQELLSVLAFDLDSNSQTSSAASEEARVQESQPEDQTADLEARLTRPEVRIRSGTKSPKQDSFRPSSHHPPADLGGALNFLDTAEENLRVDRLNELLDSASHHLKEGRIARARSLWKQVLELEPDHPEATQSLKDHPTGWDKSPPSKTGMTQAHILAQRANQQTARTKALGTRAICLLIFLFILVLTLLYWNPGSPTDAPPPATRRSSTSKPPRTPIRTKSPAPRPTMAEVNYTSPVPDVEPLDEPSRFEEPVYLSPPPGMTLITSGSFRHGPNNTEMYTEAYYIDAEEVTNEEYEKFVLDTGHATPPHWKNGRPSIATRDHPVTFVNYNDAEAYAYWAEKRLPTEYEWEKAARGTDGRPYPWGVSFEPSRANMLQSVNDLVDFGGLKPVGSYPRGKSPSGCLDMIGNALEWTSECLRPGDSRVRILKGGAWSMAREEGMAHARYTFFPATTRNEFIGFRCAMDAIPTLPE